MKKYSINNLKSIIYILTSMLIILILVFSSKSNVNEANTFCLWILGGVYFFLYLQFVFDKFIQEFLKLNKKLILILLILLFTIVLSWILPIRFQKIFDENTIKRGMKNTNISLETLGEKNNKSKGYEVCLEGIRINGNSDFNLYNITLNKDWDFIDGRPTCLKQVNSKIDINLGNINTYQILMRKNENAGKIKVKIGSNNYVYDLYSKNAENRYQIDLSELFLQNQEKISCLQVGLFYLAYFFIVLTLMFSVVIYLKLKIK